MVQDAVELANILPASGTLAGDGWDAQALRGDRLGIEWTPDDRAGPVIRVEQQEPGDWTLEIETQGGTDLGTTRYSQGPPAVFEADHEAGRIDRSIGRVQATETRDS